MNIKLKNNDIYVLIQLLDEGKSLTFTPYSAKRKEETVKVTMIDDGTIPSVRVEHQTETFAFDNELVKEKILVAWAVPFFVHKGAFTLDEKTIIKTLSKKSLNQREKQVLEVFKKNHKDSIILNLDKRKLGTFAKFLDL